MDSLGKRYDYSWDKSHNLTSVADVEDGHITYGYGKTNRLASLTAPMGTINYRYDESGRVYQVLYSTSSYKNITYHPNGWCHNIQDAGYPQMYPFNYQYYNNGNISGILSWAGEENYTYDSNDRLTSWFYTPFGGSPIQESYQYDAAPATSRSRELITTLMIRQNALPIPVLSCQSLVHK